MYLTLSWLISLQQFWVIHTYLPARKDERLLLYEIWLKGMFAGLYKHTRVKNVVNTLFTTTSLFLHGLFLQRASFTVHQKVQPNQSTIWSNLLNRQPFHVTLSLTTKVVFKYLLHMLAKKFKATYIFITSFS